MDVYTNSRHNTDIAGRLRYKQQTDVDSRKHTDVDRDTDITGSC